MEFPDRIYVFDNPVLDFSLLGENRHESDVEYIRGDVARVLIVPVPSRPIVQEDA